MQLKELNTPNKTESFISDIERRIISGELKPNDRLLSERELAKMYNVSKTIINAGLKELANKGFIIIKPRSGVFVNNYIYNGNLGVLASIMTFNHGKLDNKTFDSLMEFRLYLDNHCAKLAAINRSDDDLNVLKTLVAQIMQCNEMESMIELKMAFQHAIYCATNNSIYPLLCNSFYQISKSFNESVFKYYDYKNGRENVQELLQAIIDQDSEKAGYLYNDFLIKRIDELKKTYFK